MVRALKSSYRKSHRKRRWLFASSSSGGKILLFPGSRSALGSLEGIDTNIINLGVNFAVCGKIAEPGTPFEFGIGEGGTHFTNAARGNALTALTFFNNHFTAAAFSGAAGFFPEGTLGTGKYGLALHDFFLRYFGLAFRTGIDTREHGELSMLFSLNLIDPMQQIV